MKKTLSKIVSCFFVVGVLFASTPFFIKTKADSGITPVDLDINEYWHLNANIVNDNFYISIVPFDDYDINTPVIYILIPPTDNLSYNDSLSNVIEYDSFNLYWNQGLYMWQGQYDLSDLISNEYISYIQFMFASDMSYIYNQIFTIGFYKNINSYVYAQGYQAGQRDTINNTDPVSFISAFGDGINQILSIKIFGQVSLGTLVFIPLSMAVLLLLLKIWRRN